MLILKGKNGKSRIIETILDTMNNVCFVYNNYPLFEDSICLNSDMYSLEHLKQCIVEEVNKYQELYDYLIIYTNKAEDDLKEFIDWLNNNPPIKLFYRNIIVTCN